MLHHFGRFSHLSPGCVGRIFAGAMPRYSLLRRLVSLLLAALVLTASVGLTVQRHTCRMSGRSKVDVSVPGQRALPGCTDRMAPSTPLVKDNCCVFSSYLHKLSAPAHELAAKILVPVPLDGFTPVAFSWPTPASAVVPALPCPRWFAADSSPPPRGGRRLLAFACTLKV